MELSLLIIILNHALKQRWISYICLEVTSVYNLKDTANCQQFKVNHFWQICFKNCVCFGYCHGYTCWILLKLWGIFRCHATTIRATFHVSMVHSKRLIWEETLRKYFDKRNTSFTSSLVFSLFWNIDVIRFKTYTNCKWYRIERDLISGNYRLFKFKCLLHWEVITFARTTCIWQLLSETIFSV